MAIDIERAANVARINAAADNYLKHWPALVHAYRNKDAGVVDDFARRLIANNIITAGPYRAAYARTVATEAFERAITTAPARSTSEAIEAEQRRRQAVGAAFTDVMMGSAVGACDTLGSTGDIFIRSLNAKGYDVIRKDPGNGQQPGNAAKEHGNSGGEASHPRPHGTDL